MRVNGKIASIFISSFWALSSAQGSGVDSTEAIEPKTPPRSKKAQVGLEEASHLTRAISSPEKVLEAPKTPPKSEGLRTRLPVSPQLGRSVSTPLEISKFHRTPPSDHLRGFDLKMMQNAEKDLEKKDSKAVNKEYGDLLKKDQSLELLVPHIPVFYADDDNMNRKTLKRSFSIVTTSLKATPPPLTEAKNASDIVAKIEAFYQAQSASPHHEPEYPALILMDMNMGKAGEGEDGDDATRRIRELEQKLEIPEDLRSVIMGYSDFSHDTRDSVEKKFHNAGANFSFPKRGNHFLGISVAYLGYLHHLDEQFPHWSARHALKRRKAMDCLSGEPMNSEQNGLSKVMKRLHFDSNGESNSSTPE